MKKLTLYAKQQLCQASRSAIAEAMGQLPFQNGAAPRWLPTGQRYSDTNIAEALRKDIREGTIDDSALAQRIGASIPSHVIDGWGYFGRAIHCLVQGDTRTAVHLGYYAELRAVLAIMASEGIAILHDRHFVINKDGEATQLCSQEGKPITQGTHQTIWPVYNWWIQQTAAFKVFSTIIKPGGREIQDWFDLPGQQKIYLGPTAATLLDAWGLDLKRMQRDREARNASSYGPSAIHNWEVIGKSEAVEAVVQLWQAFEPHENSRFDVVDRLILKQVLTVAFQGQTGRNPRIKKWHRSFCQFVDNFLDHHNDYPLVQVDRTNWHRFLAGNGTATVPTALERASNDSVSSVAWFPIEMLSRAGLLLRIASGSCGLHLSHVGATWDSLMFWLNDIGIRRGYWDQYSGPESPIDLWVDISEALEDMDEVRNTDHGLAGGSDGSLANSLFRLEECERIGMWGFGV